MTLDEMQEMLQAIIGKDKFIQFAFYMSPLPQTGLVKPWVKVETEIEVNQYRAWQSRTEDTLEGNFMQCVAMIKNDLKGGVNMQDEQAVPQEQPQAEAATPATEEAA